MSEEVNTGGLHKFVRRKGEELRLDDERKSEIRDAYARADERKETERKNRILFWIIGLVVLAGLLIVLKLLV